MTTRGQIRIDLFPNGWCIRRADGAIASIQGFQSKNIASAFKRASLRAASMDLAPLHTAPQPNVSLARLPKAQTKLRHRFYAARPHSQQWSIYLSFQLPLTVIGSGRNRRYRWTSVAVGKVSDLEPARIEQAWRRVYAMWAWATSLKSKMSAEQIFALEAPGDVECYLDLIDLPSAPTVSMLWERLGFDPGTGRDIAARQKERFASM
jgi:hypothetical protein